MAAGTREKHSTASSAGNTRGLIEANTRRRAARRVPCLPRGIPAASLKPRRLRRVAGGRLRLPRGIPAASLKHDDAMLLAPERPGSSAGNTRGLIEAVLDAAGIAGRGGSSAGNTRGLIEATRDF